MKTLVTVGLLVACWVGAAPVLRAQMPEPPEPIRPAPIHLPPDFRQGPQPRHPRRPPFDARKAQQRAQELAKLADPVPEEINQVSHGVLPKDLIQRLKKIEKLSKQLRKQVTE